MQALLGILGFIFIFGLAVLVHELGHFLTARKYGVLCHEFAIGMGPIIWKKRNGETLYTIRAIPIGGFVSMGMNEGERDIFKIGTEIGLTFNYEGGEVSKIHYQPTEGQIIGKLLTNTIDVSGKLEIEIEVAGEAKIYPVDREAFYVDSKADRMAQIVPLDRRLESKPKRQRFVIMVAGAVMNFILAYVIALIIGFAQGEVVGSAVVLQSVVEGGPAYNAGFEVGDIINEIDGVSITSGVQVSEQLRIVGNREVLIGFERDGQASELYVTPNLQDNNYVISVVTATNFIMGDRSIPGAFRSANTRWRHDATLIVTSLRMLATGEAGAGDLTGVVGIVQITGQVAMAGFLPLLMFAVLININLGMFNLLPFPALDGGHITFIAIEAVIGKPVNAKIQMIVSMIGFGLLLLLMLFTVFNDILRIVN